MVDPPFSHVNHFGQTSTLLCCLSSARNDVNSYRRYRSDLLHYRSPITGLWSSKPKIPPLTSFQRLPANRLAPSSEILRQSNTNEGAVICPLHSFGVTLLGSNQLTSKRVFFSLERRHKEDTYDLYALSGLYDERSLHGPLGELRGHVDCRLALS